MFQKILFFFFVIVLAFLPGGIFISVFLLALYYLVPMFLANKYTIKFEIKDNSLDQNDTMNQYSENTLEEIK
ncbi:MAG: hypothetical protein IS860_11500 [Nitrosopumilus sp.]|nr:hypothetical protein [Nitrosopumilus sp.]